jgi:hypothetical protein
MEAIIFDNGAFSGSVRTVMISICDSTRRWLV